LFENFEVLSHILRKHFVLLFHYFQASHIAIDRFETTAIADETYALYFPSLEFYKINFLPLLSEVI
jgi:hypothetical protein